MAISKQGAVKKVETKKSVAKQAPAAVATQRGVDWRSLYLYAVCLITLLVVLFSVVSLINGLVNVIFPDPAYVDVYAPQGATKASAAALAAQNATNQRHALKSMFTAFTTIAVAAPLYLYHWRETKRIN